MERVSFRQLGRRNRWAVCSTLTVANPFNAGSPAHKRAAEHNIVSVRYCFLWVDKTVVLFLPLAPNRPGCCPPAGSVKDVNSITPMKTLFNLDKAQRIETPQTK